MHGRGWKGGHVGVATLTFFCDSWFPCMLLPFRCDLDSTIMTASDVMCFVGRTTSVVQGDYTWGLL